jgi:hypothetical protein
VCPASKSESEENIQAEEACSLPKSSQHVVVADDKVIRAQDVEVPKGPKEDEEGEFDEDGAVMV